MSEYDKFLKHLEINPDEMRKELLQKVEAEENKRHDVEKCPFCKKLAVIKKPYTKGAGYFYQCTYCGAVK